MELFKTYQHKARTTAKIVVSREEPMFDVWNQMEKIERKSPFKKMRSANLDTSQWTNRLIDMEWGLTTGDNYLI